MVAETTHCNHYLSTKALFKPMFDVVGYGARVVGCLVLFCVCVFFFYTILSDVFITRF